MEGGRLIGGRLIEVGLYRSLQFQVYQITFLLGILQEIFLLFF